MPVNQAGTDTAGAGLQAKLRFAVQKLIAEHFQTDTWQTDTWPTDTWPTDTPRAANRGKQLIPCAIAYSTGADSTALLHAAMTLQDELNLDLCALHINHGLHADNLSWQQLAQQTCARLKIRLVLQSVQVCEHGYGLEAAARSARYRAFRQQLATGGILLLAHHMHDQAETMLLHLLRGSGADGLSGMPRCRPMGAAWLLRPWLDCRREQLRAYCHAQDLVYTVDSSNADPRFDRGWLRDTLIPQLEQRKPGAVANIAYSAGLIAHCRQLAGWQLDVTLSNILRQPECVEIQALLTIPSRTQQHDLLRYWIKGLQLPPPGRRQLDELLSQLDRAAKDKQPLLALPEYCLQRYQGGLYLYTSAPTLPKECIWNPPLIWHWPGVGKLAIVPAGSPGRQHDQGLSAKQQSIDLTRSKIHWPEFRISLRQGGEKILQGGKHHHKLKKLLQDADMPPWQRSRLPLVWHRRRLIAAGGQWLHPALWRWLQKHDLKLQWKTAMEQK